VVYNVDTLIRMTYLGHIQHELSFTNNMQNEVVDLRSWYL